MFTIHMPRLVQRFKYGLKFKLLAVSIASLKKKTILVPRPFIKRAPDLESSLVNVPPYSGWYVLYI